MFGAGTAIGAYVGRCDRKLSPTIGVDREALDRRIARRKPRNSVVSTRNRWSVTPIHLV